MKNYLKDKRGFTMIEMVVVLAVIAILSAVLAPMTLNYIKDAKVNRAEADVKAIANAILALNNDTRAWPVKTAATTGNAENIVRLTVGSGRDGVAPADAGSKLVSTANVDTVENHLNVNTAAYATTGKYLWRGPYLQKFDADPWGNLYYVDVTGLQKVNLGTPGSKAFVISAGPNETLDTVTGDGTAVTAGSDDIMYMIK